MILAWDQLVTPENKFQVVYFFHSKDWVHPISSLSQPCFNGAFETLLKFDRDAQATRISAPNQTKDDGLTLFHTAILAAKRRIPEHFQNKVNLYCFALQASSQDELKVYSNLPPWISVYEICINQNFFQWTKQTPPKPQMEVIQVAAQNATVGSEILFYFGTPSFDCFALQSQKVNSKNGSARIVDLLESQQTPLQGPLTSIKTLPLQMKSSFKEFEV